MTCKCGCVKEIFEFLESRMDEDGVLYPGDVAEAKRRWLKSQ